MELKNYFAQTSTGVVISGATFYVYNSGTTVLATIYDKDGVALANPSTATSHGLIQFRATDGDYEVTVLSGSSSYSIPCKCFDGNSAFRECLRRSYSEPGYTLVEGTFGTGATLQSQFDVLLNEKDNKVYSWTGAYPSGGYVVAPGTDPTTPGSGFIIRSDATLRVELTGAGGDISDLANTIAHTSKASSITSQVGSIIHFVDRDEDFLVTSGIVPDGFGVIQLAGSNVARPLNASIDIQSLGAVYSNSSDASRTLNDLVYDAALGYSFLNTIEISDSIYFHKGKIVTTDARNKAVIGVGNFPVKCYFDQVTSRNSPTARISTLETTASLWPESDPTKDNTAFGWGTKTTQVGRMKMRNIRVINDSATDTYTNKDSRVGTGIFINSGWADYDRIITEGWHVGSYENSFTTSRRMCEHIAFNIGFIYPAGTSSDLSGMFANGTNYDTSSSTWTVTYTTGEDDAMFGRGYIFGQLYYSAMTAFAVDKIQKGYCVYGNSASYRTHLEFIGCGAEWVVNDFEIIAPNTSVAIDGGQDWGVPVVKKCSRVNVRNRRFPSQTDTGLSSGVVTVDPSTFELQNPVDVAGKMMSVPVVKGYNGLSYHRVKADAAFKYWRIHGRLEVNQFGMRKNYTVNGVLSGTLKFSYLSGNNGTEFANSFGTVELNFIRQSSTSRQQSTISPALNVTVAVVGNYLQVDKPALTAGNLMAVDVDLELKTSFSGDLSKLSGRPDELLFLGIDY